MLPTKQIIPISVVCLLIVGMAFYYFENKNNHQAIQFQNSAGVEAMTNAAIEKNVTAQLQDWKKTLSEIRPDTSSEEIAKIASSTNTNRALTDTDKFSRDLFTRYVQLKQGGSGDPADYSNYTDIVNQYIAKAEQSQVFITHGALDFKIVEETASNLHVYGNALGKILLQSNQSKLKNELLILQEATDAENPKMLSKLDENLSSYKKVLAGLLNVPVPQSYLPAHIALTNSVETMIAGVQAMKITATDPITAIAGLEKYPDATGTFIAALKDIRQGLFDAKVSFAQNEDGYPLFSGI